MSNILELTVEKQLIHRKDRHNVHNVHAVTVVEGDNLVSHVACSISAVYYFFKSRSVTIITGSQRYSVNLLQIGLELPCRLVGYFFCFY